MTYGHPHSLYGMQEPCNCQWWEPCNRVPLTCTIWFECGNLVTVNDIWSPHTLYGMWELCSCQWQEPVTGSPHMYNMIWMWEPCNCQWLMVPLPYMVCRNLVTVNDGNFEMGCLHMYDVIFSGCQWWEPWKQGSPHISWEPCNCQ